METQTVYSVDRRVIERAVEIMRKGGIIVYPTDTHPALGADSLNTEAIQALCRLKRAQ